MNNIEGHKLTVAETIKEAGSSVMGISIDEAARRLSHYGPNEVMTKKSESLLVMFLRQFQSPLIYILVFAALISFAVGKVSSTFVILFVLMTNATMGFIQEGRAKRTMEALRKLSAPKTKVIREGAIIEIPTKEVVPGDIIVFESGSKISADARVIEAINLEVDEASLTGESHAVRKLIEPIKADMSIGDRINMVHSGTVVNSGKGKAVVLATGINTEIGKIAEMIRGVAEVKTPFQMKMEGFGKFIIILVTAQVTVAFFIGKFLRNMSFHEIFLVAISQMVSSIPEGLPVAVTVALAIGMQRMAKRKALVRKLAAVEGLGSATVICSDKTGTLTKNEMTARRLSTINHEVNISGAGYDISGIPEFRNSLDGKKINPLQSEEIKTLLHIAILCNDAHFNAGVQGGEKEVLGDPTEIAYLVAAAKSGMDYALIKKSFPRIDELPFESHIRLMATKHETSDGKSITYMKGSPEKILGICGFYYQNGRKQILTDEIKDIVLKKVVAMASSALRVLGFCFMDGGEKLQIDTLSGKMVFVGLIGNMDPPRAEVKEAVKICQKAGVRTIMATGDHLATAMAVATELGISGIGGITGSEIEKMTEKELADAVRKYPVFARIEPKHKFQIVKSLQNQGEVVAMTGDGVNDAPALATADIGVAMGITGTDVAKESSSIIIADDNFATIVCAIEEGRGITSNMRKTVSFLLCSSSAEILILMTALVLGLPLPLLALMILWINLIIDGAITIPLIMEPKEDVMNRPPDKKDASIVTKEMLKILFFRVPIMAAVVLGIYVYKLSGGHSLEYIRTVAFTTLFVAQWASGMSSRSNIMSVFKGFFRNKYIIGSFVVSFALHLTVLYMPFLQKVFGTVPLTLSDWLQITFVGSLVLVAEEIKKFIFARKLASPECAIGQ